jgi:hypothetical protein
MDYTLATAFCFAWLSHKRVREIIKGDLENTSSAQDTRMRDFCEMESIKMINKAIQDSYRSTCDAVILSVLSMANNVADDPVYREVKRSPFQAPLLSLQWLDVYGRVSANPVHQVGLIRLITMRGGLHSLKLKGLAAIIS